MSYLDNHHITLEGPKKSFQGRVQKTIQRVQHDQYGWCFRVWYSGNGDDVLFKPAGKDSVIEVGIIPGGIESPSTRDKKLIRWAIEHYEPQQQLDLKQPQQTSFDDSVEEDHPFSGDAVQPEYS